MSQGQRFGVIAVSLAVIVGVFILLRPSTKSDADESVSTGTKQTQTSPQNTEQSATDAAPAAGEKNDAAQGDKKSLPLLTAGRIEKIKVHKGEQVHFQVLSQKAEEVHVHGYDIAKDLPAGEKVDVSFKANLEGKFEIELEGAGEQLAELTVTP